MQINQKVENRDQEGRLRKRIVTLEPNRLGTPLSVCFSFHYKLTEEAYGAHHVTWMIFQRYAKLRSHVFVDNVKVIWLCEPIDDKYHILM